MEVTGSASRLRELWRFMATKSFIAGRAELMEHGFGSSQVQSWLRSGRMIPVVHGVYSYGRDVESADAAWTASLVAAGTGSALTGVSACEKWGLVDLRQVPPKRIEVAVGKGHARILQGISPAMRDTRIRVVRRELEPADIRRVDGIDLLEAGLALLDFAENATDRQIRFAFLEACRLHLFNAGDVQLSLRRMVGRRGATKLRPLVALWVPELKRIRSVFEGLYLLKWIEHGYPMPLVNERVFGCEVDLFWPGQSLVLELDGGTYHGDPVQRAIDLEKQQSIEARGIQVLRLAYKRFDEDPDRAVEVVAGRLGFLVEPEILVG